MNNILSSHFIYVHKMKLRIINQCCFSSSSFFQLGIAVGFVLPPMLVGNHDDIELIGSDLKLMFYLVAGLTSILVVLMVLCKYLLIVFWMRVNQFFLQSSRIIHQLHHQLHKKPPTQIQKVIRLSCNPWRILLWIRITFFFYYLTVSMLVCFMLSRLS